jgi:hypothetical protein
MELEKENVPNINNKNDEYIETYYPTPSTLGKAIPVIGHGGP